MTSLSSLLPWPLPASCFALLLALFSSGSKALAWLILNLPTTFLPHTLDPGWWLLLLEGVFRVTSSTGCPIPQGVGWERGLSILLSNSLCVPTTFILPLSPHLVLSLTHHSTASDSAIRSLYLLIGFFFMKFFHDFVFIFSLSIGSLNLAYKDTQVFPS